MAQTRQEKLDAIAKSLAKAREQAAGIGAGVVRLAEERGRPEIAQRAREITGAIFADTLGDTATVPTLPPIPTTQTIPTTPTPTPTVPTTPTPTGLPSGVTQGLTTFQQSLLDMLGETKPEPISKTELEAEAGLPEKQQLVDELNTQLADITQRAITATQTIESQAGGRDITGTFLGRQQQEIARRAMIEAAPIQAQLQTAAGNLQAAQRIFENTFDDEIRYQEQLYNWQQNRINMVYDFATANQKAILDQRRIDDKNAFTLLRDKINNANDIMKMAMSEGDTDTAAAITKLLMNPESPTFDSDLADLQAGITIEAIEVKEGVKIKFSSDDINRLANTGLSSTDIDNIQKDINEYGVGSVKEGLPKNQAEVLDDILSGVTPTQARAEEKAEEKYDVSFLSTSVYEALKRDYKKSVESFLLNMRTNFKDLTKQNIKTLRQLFEDQQKVVKGLGFLGRRAYFKK